MKTITLLFCLFTSTFLFGQYPFAIHPNCSTNLDSVTLKQCSEEKILATIHDRIRYKHYTNNQYSTIELTFDINGQGYIEPIAVKILGGVDVKTDVENALKHLSYQTVFKPAEEEGFTFYDNKKLVVKFTEATFLTGDSLLIKDRAKTPVNKKIAAITQYIENLPVSSSQNEIFKVVQEMPRFFSPECEAMEGDVKAKEECAKEKMFEFIYGNIKYPSIARENGVEGTVVIQFIVEPDDTISELKTKRDIGAKCGAEALRVIDSIKDFTIWIPGMFRGERVRVQYNLPVKFILI